MKKLPKIYKSVVVNDNNKKCFYSKNEDFNNNIDNINKNINISKNIDINKNLYTSNNLDINSKINNLLRNNVMYSREVTLILKNNKIRTRIIRKYDNYILTIDNDKIKYSDIIDILE